MNEESNILNNYGSFFGKLVKNELSDLIGESTFLGDNLEVYAEMAASEEKAFE